MALAERVRQLREKAGLTVQELALASGLSIASIYKIEEGRRPDPQWSSIQALARALGVNTDDLKCGPV